MDYREFKLNPGSHMLHAYLITPGCDRSMSVALDMARAAVCSSEGPRPCGICPGCRKAMMGIHPDIVVISRSLDSSGKEKGEIVVSQAREIIADAYVLPNESEGKAYIINDADSMNLSAQNALLKLLEEPPSYAYFFLLASSPRTLLPTVRSRLAHVNLPPEEKTPAVQSEATGHFLSSLDSGSMALAEFCVSIEKLDRDSMREFLGNTQAEIVEIIKNTGSSPKLLEAALLFRKLERFSSANVSSGHIAGIIAAKFCV